MLERAAARGADERADTARIREVGSGGRRLTDIKKATEAAVEKRADAGDGQGAADATALRYSDEVELGFCDGAVQLATISESARSGRGAGIDADAVSERG